MALDARRRQRKAEKRKAKERAKRKVLSQRKADDMGGRIARAGAAPILHCCTFQSLWDKGLAQVLISRELSCGSVAFSVFLIDRYCLGVKDAFCNFAARSEYFERLYDKLARQGQMVALQPAAARKLVEGAVQYAKSLGLSPHADYARARNIFGNIDPAESDRTFEFGDKGKPHFIAGPHDSPGRIASVMGILTDRLGPDGFHFIVPLTSDAIENGDLIFLDGSGDDEDYENDFADDENDADDTGDVVEGKVIADSPPERRWPWPLPILGFGSRNSR